MHKVPYANNIHKHQRLRVHSITLDQTYPAHVKGVNYRLNGDSLALYLAKHSIVMPRACSVITSVF